MSVKTLAWVFVALLPLASACQWLAPRPVDPMPPVSPPEPPVRHDNLAALIAYFVSVDSLSGEALENEIAIMADKYSTDDSAATRLCLAYLLGLAVHKPQYRERARQLLHDIQQELYTAPDYKDLARFLARDQQRYNAQRENLRAEQQQRQQLQQQLDALKDIERKISERKTMPINGVEGPNP